MNVDEVPGWKKDHYGEWHATTAFDGYEFDAVCGLLVDNSERGSWVGERDLIDERRDDVCSDCLAELDGTEVEA